MPIYSFYIFDRHCECIYVKQWLERERNSLRPTTSSGASIINSPLSGAPDKRISAGTIADQSLRTAPGRLSVQDDAKLVFGVVFSLRNMVRKLSGPEDNFVSYRTGSYKLHYYETATNLKFVMLTDVKMSNLRVVLHQIYVNLYVEYVTKNPLSPVEHPGGEGVAVELFELGLDRFVQTIQEA
ncbi:Longin-like domain-containing protein [Pyronema domesticum]|uniref:Trafficking protein particle complex subunit n=1 Tax=Pyronema omphalodes (strain CBS 100304) TaxID=1076935 RepID=U4L632_PYROM|nr:Longin-like domain-containing protein [Pyronema domesticum]KAI5819857.1 Longin-like domain-containing protein [Pyronema omphalodes]CCX11804.1 Similar to Transport protein particle subunit bet5; acc. no. Q9UT70 [Pyronema omphalodes CBS 100304]